MDDPFANIIDDRQEREAARGWAFDCLRAGQSPESVEAQLLASGWSASDAAEMAEEARKRTRHMRGVITRDEIAGIAETAYRKRELTAFDPGYIAPPAGFVDDQGVGQGGGADSATATPTGRSYHAPDKQLQRSIARARVRSLLLTFGGIGLFLLGLILTIAMYQSERGITQDDYKLLGGCLLGGLGFLIFGMLDHRSPPRLIVREDRGLLDKIKR